MTHNEKRAHWIREGLLNFGIGIVYGVTVTGSSHVCKIETKQKAILFVCLFVGFVLLEFFIFFLLYFPKAVGHSENENASSSRLRKHDNARHFDENVQERRHQRSIQVLNLV